MPFDQLLRANFRLALLPAVGLVALLNARAMSELVGVALAPDEATLTSAARMPAKSAPLESAHVPSADPILARNPFDHVTGPLRQPVATDNGADPDEPATDASGIWSVPECDGVTVHALAAGEPNWSFASVAGADGKRVLKRRGDEVAGKKVHFVGWDRVWFESGGAICQAKLFAPKATPPPSPPPAPTPAPSSTRPVRGARAVDADIKRGIQKVSDTEYNVDRGTLDKILENQADLMRQARITPVQENGRVVGIRMNGIRPDTLLGVLGMQNGDSLQTINGFDMSSPEKALEAYARLRTADKLTVQISRGGKAMNLDYHIR